MHHWKWALGCTYGTIQLEGTRYRMHSRTRYTASSSAMGTKMYILSNPLMALVSLRPWEGQSWRYVSTHHLPFKLLQGDCMPVGEALWLPQGLASHRVAVSLRLLSCLVLNQLHQGVTQRPNNFTHLDAFPAQVAVMMKSRWEGPIGPGQDATPIFTMSPAVAFIGRVFLVVCAGSGSGKVCFGRWVVLLKMWVYDRLRRGWM